MYEYKVISVETFMEIPEIKNINNKEKFKVGETELSRSNSVVNFMQLMFDYMGSKGWEYCGITSTHTDKIDLFATGKGAAVFFKKVGQGIFSRAMNVPSGYVDNQGIIETYIFKRIVGNKIVSTSESNASFESKPSAKLEQSITAAQSVQPNNISDESLDENALIKLNKIVNPLIDKLKAVGYVVTDSKNTMSTNYWRITYPRNGSFCELNSVKELQDFAENF